MCPKVANDEANPGEEAFPTSRAVVGWCRRGASSSGLACVSFLLCVEGSVLFAVVAPWLTMRRQQGLSGTSDSKDSVLLM